MPIDRLQRILSKRIEHVLPQDRNPCLLLDKYTLFTRDGMISQKQSLQRACDCRGDVKMLDFANKLNNEMLAQLKASSFTAKLVSPMALHLSRANALENGGICLHRTYGFAYLPGSGLKGMARAFAETVWLPVQQDKRDAKRIIADVFGTGSDNKNCKAGAVVFHDALPVRWPKLQVDITNCHYPQYYNGNEPPGDWMEPVPVYFPVVERGSVFKFAVSPTSLSNDRMIDLARIWLAGALEHLGAGAKTAAGYGCFEITNDEQLKGSSLKIWKGSADSSTYERYSVTLELATPAFLAGPNQEKADCDLRSATMRGLLRWWWRKLHAGHISDEDLKKLEGAVWGNTEVSSPISIEIHGFNEKNPALYDYRDKFNIKQNFANEHKLTRPPFRSSPGLFYMSYGMNDGNPPKVRFYMPEGAKWRIELKVRSGKFKRGNQSFMLSKVSLLGEACAALWLLCKYGGVGGKSRRGFGSLCDIDIDGHNLEDWLDYAAGFREDCGFPDEDHRTSSFSFAHRIAEFNVQTETSDPWRAIHELGMKYQKFAQGHKHSEAKKALGLPRQIHGPRNNPMGDQKNHKRPQPLRCAKGNRYSSPVLFHLSKGNDKKYTVRCTIFSAPNLHDEASRAFLKGIEAKIKAQV